MTRERITIDIDQDGRCQMTAGGICGRTVRSRDAEQIKDYVRGRLTPILLDDGGQIAWTPVVMQPQPAEGEAALTE